MIDYEQVEILLVEDSETDAEMTMRALGRKHLANNLVWVKDGAEALDFLAKVYEQQKQQQQHGRPGEPDPNAVFAVDISKDLAAGQVDGPNDALVTIVEAWDFG